MTLIDVVFDNAAAFQIDIHYDVNAWLAGVRPEHLQEADLNAFLTLPLEVRANREAEFRQFIERRIKLRFDDAVFPYSIAYAPKPEGVFSNPHSAMAPGRIVQLTGTIPQGAREFVISCSKTFGNVILTLRTGEMLPIIQRLDAGGRSEPYPFGEALERDNAGSVVAPKQSAWEVSRMFLWLGFEHILPLGLDHIVFVLALFLLSRRWSALLWQVTAFTVAHSITLSLAVLGVIQLSESTIARGVEPLIAVSIAFVAIENLLTSKLHAWRPVVVFLFGLLHGLGFASVLMELGIPRGHFVNALASFNIGVEIGQLAVIGLAVLAVGWWRTREWYRRRIVMPVSCAIALVGIYWAIERVAGI
ncbi:MAG TPA: HupE/UreJ family protein [Phycisphaerae bacterium]|nr:HupE/UreJ family protein [Phycisphaerae bacterium]